jgi:uncharacterized protein
VDELDLLDWKRRISALYAEIRMLAPEDGWRLWRDTRDELFRSHPQSPLPAEARASFTALPYFDYDPALRVLAEVEPAEQERIEIATSGEHPYAFTRLGRVHVFDETLDVYWLEGYGGGVFLSFADATSGRETYAACRYLLDTVKGADLGGDIDPETGRGSLVIDLNFAYNPSCAYD